MMQCFTDLHRGGPLSILKQIHINNEDKVVTSMWKDDIRKHTARISFTSNIASSIICNNVYLRVCLSLVGKDTKTYTAAG